MQLQWNPPEISSISCQFNWTADYATNVHEGDPVTGGGIGIARPWTDVAIGRNDLPAIFTDLYNGDIRETFRDVCEHMENEFNDVLDNYDWGVIGRGLKQYKNAPTWQTITDSGNLKESLEVTFSDSL